VVKPTIRVCGISAVAVLAFVRIAGAVPVSYSANLSTSKGNPVTDVLIIEADGAAPARATVYPTQLPGTGTAIISHDAPFAPTKSLIIGLTEGLDEFGADKTQIVMFLDVNFAAANAGVLFSSVFPGVRHSETIARLRAAVAGDAVELAWFTDTFFTGSAAAAAFATGGAFTVAEFTGLTIIGTNATAGNWMITSFQALAANNPNAQSNRATALIGETAKIDLGPFDIELSVGDAGELAFDKTVLNNTGENWNAFRLLLGTGTGANFVPSTALDGLSFVASLNNREDTGAFPNVLVEEDRIFFTGALAVGGTARFVVFVNTQVDEPHTVTLRQVAIGTSAPAPVMGRWSLAVLILLLGGLASLKLRRL